MSHPEFDPAQRPERDAEDIVARLRLRARLEDARLRADGERGRSGGDGEGSWSDGDSLHSPATRAERRGRHLARSGDAARAARRESFSFAGIRLSVDPRLGLAALVVVALVAGGAIVWQSRAGPQEIELNASSAPAPESTNRSSGASGGASPTTAPDGQVWVHVAGQVAKPGLVRLQAGARVSDAIEAAGGASGKADLAAVNLARKVADGEQVYLPALGESAPGGSGGAAAGGGPGGGAGSAGGTGPGAGGKVNVNTADAAGLDELPGVGPVLAERIVAHRNEHGPFSQLDDLLDVSGIGPAVLDKMREQATV